MRSRVLISLTGLLAAKETTFSYQKVSLLAEFGMTDPGRFDELLAIHIASGSTVRSAAAEVGCSERQAYRLANNPDFRRRVNELRTEATQMAVGKLASAATAAVDVLVQLLAADMPAATRLSAAKAILQTVVPMSEQLELRKRIDELEQARTFKVAQ